MSSQLDRAFVKAYTRSRATSPSATTPARSHLQPQAPTASTLNAIDGNRHTELQATAGWGDLADESYFRVDVGHAQSFRSNLAPLPPPAAAHSAPAGADRSPVPRPTVPQVHHHPTSAQGTNAFEPFDPSTVAHAPSSALSPGVSQERVADLRSYSGQQDIERGESAVELYPNRQWTPPAIQEPQEYYRVRRDIEQANAFALAKMEALGETSIVDVPPPATVSTSAASAGSTASPTAAADQRAFEPVWEVDALEFSDTIVGLFGDARLMKSIGGPLDHAVATGLRSLLITSPARCAGRTSVAIGIAVSAAAAGLRVALVDADTGSVGLADVLRMEVQHDWVQAARISAPLDEVAIRSIEDQLTVLPLVPGSDAAPYTALEFDQMLSRLCESFDLVVVDGTPWLGEPHVLQQTRTIDAAIVVVDSRNRSDDQINWVQNDLRRCGVAGLGIVENFA